MEQLMTAILKPSLHKRPLGTSGLDVSALAWGMWRFKGDLAAADRLVRTVLDLGLTLLDTADIYGLDSTGSFGSAETLLGQVLGADPGLRHRFVLASKGGIVPGTPYDSSREYLISACEASLRRLGTDTIDLYQIHRPDVLSHPHEVAAALSTLRDAGKIRAAGVSNYTVGQTRALQSCLPFSLASTQPEYSALCLDPLVDGTLDLALELNLAVLPWSPLAGGRLAGAGIDERSRAVIAALDEMASRRSVPRTAVALAWVMAHPSRPIPIIGTQHAGRLEELVRALDVTLTRTEWYAILTASRQARLP
jgi:aryl-alcohol dehydrogenase-like predicted oxidoreductase